MNPETERAMAQALISQGQTTTTMPAARPVGSIRNVVKLGFALLLGHHLLVKAMPMLWSVTLPGGLGGARELPGWAGLIFVLALICEYRFSLVAAAGGTLLIGAVAANRLGRSGQFLVRLTTMAVLALDAGIALVIVRTALAGFQSQTGVRLM